MLFSEFTKHLNTVEEALLRARDYSYDEAAYRHILTTRNFTLEQKVVNEMCTYALEHFDALISDYEVQHAATCVDCRNELHEAVDRSLSVLREYRAGTIGNFAPTLSASYFKRDDAYTEGISVCLAWSGGQLTILDESAANRALVTAVRQSYEPTTLDEFMMLQLPTELLGYTLGEGTVSYWGVFDDRQA